MPDFTIDLISETIEKYILNHGIVACFFDYINDSPSLYEYYYNKTHTRLRTCLLYTSRKDDNSQGTCRVKNRR